MKTKQRLQVILATLSDVKKASQGEKELGEVLDFVGNMAEQIIESLRMRKREVKERGREQTEKIKADMLVLESQLFSTKVESETLKIDKKYFEE
jgi:hypothetical protein